ncbi:MAG TPA: PEGA domain-containing protein [Myxococcota bacterium]|nr:PEGA domain-containing protein [Myxococcota bacterium]HRY93911.1 PEGA domain-containing protein [Myxococcota bacterium]
MGPKRDPREAAGDGSLLDPDAFWKEDGAGPATPPAGARPPRTGQLPAPLVLEEEEDTDVLVVGGPPPAARPPAARTQTRRPAAGPAPVGRPARRQPTPATAASPAPFEPPLPVHARPGPAPRPPGEAGQGTASIFQRRVLLVLLPVALLSALLGWFLIGRFAGEEPSPAPPAPQAAPEAGVGATVERAEPAAEAPARPAAPPKAVPTSELTVLSDPPSAEVLVNDQFRGLTPVTVHGIPRQGEIALRVQLAGYQPWEQRIAMAEAQPELQITAGLVKNAGCPGGHGWVYVTSEPAGASVDLDGKRRPGKTPLVIDKVCAGEHDVLVQAEGRQAYRGQVTVQANAVQNLNLSLKP